MTGGGSLLHGLNRMLEKRTGIPTYIAEDAISCVAKGTGMALEHIDILEKSMMTQRRR
jgi:rod shape-determining protein MreB